jgi:hypothetical protein
LANADPLLRGAKVAGPKNANDDDSEISKENGNEKPCFGEQYCSRQQGLDVRKISSPGGSGEVFFLDIPFYRTRQENASFTIDEFVSSFSSNRSKLIA